MNGDSLGRPFKIFICIVGLVSGLLFFAISLYLLALQSGNLLQGKSVFSKSIGLSAVSLLFIGLSYVLIRACGRLLFGSREEGLFSPFVLRLIATLFLFSSILGLLLLVILPLRGIAPWPYPTTIASLGTGLIVARILFNLAKQRAREAGISGDNH